MILPVSKKSAWQQLTIENYLSNQSTPMRLAVTQKDGFPLICSVWHHYRDGKLYAVAHKNSQLVKSLSRSSQCAFEVAPNHPPYKGVRGKAICQIEEGATDMLSILIEKFSIQCYQELTQFLSNRIEDERTLVLSIKTITAWDFTQRMTAKS